MRHATTIVALAATLATAPAATPVYLSPLGGPSGKAATSILADDLGRAGVFSLVPAPSASSHTITGSSTGGRIDAVLKSPSGKTLFARSYNGPGIKKNAHRFADDITHTITGKPGIASATIAFVSDRSGTRQVYLCDSDGSNVRQVTSDPSPAVTPCLGPDGSYLTFTSYRSGYPDVEFIDLLTGSRHPVTDSPGTNSCASIAPDGRRIALTKSLTGNPELYISHIGGGRTTRLTRTNSIETSPTWSPDGHEIVYTTFTDSSPPALFRIRSAGGKPEPLPTGHANSDAADWSPDGARIAFQFVDASQRSKIAVLEIDSGTVKTIASGSAPAWAPDSHHLAYTHAGNLVIHDVDTGTTTPVVTTDGHLSDPSWTR